MSKLKERSEISDEYKWDLSGLFASNEAWESAFETVDEPIAALMALKGTLSDSAENLAECIRLEDIFDREISRLWTYAHLRSDEDTADAFYMGMQDRVKSKYTEISAGLAWINPEILARDGVDA